jgi:hypothetical protein
VAPDAAVATLEALGIEGVGAGLISTSLLQHASDAISVADRESGRFLVVSD